MIHYRLPGLRIRGRGYTEVPQKRGTNHKQRESEGLSLKHH